MIADTRPPPPAGGVRHAPLAIRYRLRTLLIVLLLAPPLIAAYVAAGFAARDAARAIEQIRTERALLAAERASLEKERALQPAARSPGSGDNSIAPAEVPAMNR
jgi:hypothetical protein